MRHDIYKERVVLCARNSGKPRQKPKRMIECKFGILSPEFPPRHKWLAIMRDCGLGMFHRAHLQCSHLQEDCRDRVFMASKVNFMKLFGLLPMFMLLACQGSAEIDINQARDGKIHIVVFKEGDERPCVYGLSISHTSGGKIYPDWDVYLEEGHRDFCVNRFTYPNIPPHYYLLQQPNALKSGGKYEVSVTGVGFGAGKQFVRVELPSQTP